MESPEQVLTKCQPCAYCGIGELGLHPKRSFWQIQCLTCGLASPLGGDELGAVDGWNDLQTIIAEAWATPDGY